jgi:hypothetical protein
MEPPKRTNGGHDNPSHLWFDSNEMYTIISDMVRTKATQTSDLTNPFSPYVRFTLPNLNAPRAFHQGPIYGIPPTLIERDPNNQRLLVAHIWQQIKTYLPPTACPTTAHEFCNHLGIRRGEYKNSNGRSTPCLYWCTNDEEYATHITEAQLPAGRSDVRTITIFGGLDIHLGLFAASKDKTTKDAIFQECLKTSQQIHKIHTVDVTYLLDSYLNNTTVTDMVDHFPDLLCIIPVKQTENAH